MSFVPKTASDKPVEEIASMRWMLLIPLMLACGPAALAQQSEARVGFDVAAIRPAAPLSEQQVAPGNYTRLGLNVFETRIAAGNVSVFELVLAAFEVQPYQVIGPSWLREPQPLRFDVRLLFRRARDVRTFLPCCGRCSRNASDSSLGSKRGRLTSMSWW